MELHTLLEQEGLLSLEPMLQSQTLSEHCALLTADRPLFLSRLRSYGVSKLGDRQRLANVMLRAIREGRIAPVRPIPHLVPCSWEQTDEAVIVRLRIPGGTRACSIDYKLDVNSLETTINGERTSLCGRLAAPVKPADSTWEIERAPSAEVVAYEREIPPDDSLVATLCKSARGEWARLWQSGDGSSARKIEPEATRTPARAPVPKQKTQRPQAAGGAGPMAFVPRKMVLGSDARRSEQMVSSRAADAGVEETAPARDHWDAITARYIWPDGLDLACGAAEAAEGEEPFFSWTETATEVCLSASTRRGLRPGDLSLEVSGGSGEVLIDGLPTPWRGLFSGKVDPDRCEVRVVPQEGAEADKLELRLFKADRRYWRAPFKEMLATVNDQERRRLLPRREALMEDQSWTCAQLSSSWRVRVPILWEHFKGGTLRLSEVRVGFTRRSINVHIAGQEDAPLLAGELHGLIVPHECSWKLLPPGKTSKHAEIDISIAKETSQAGAFGHWKDLVKTWYV